MDTQLFFEEAEPFARQRRLLEDICGRCTVFNECLDWALRHEMHGWWANTTEEQRHKFRRSKGVSLRRIGADVWTAGHGTAARYARHRRECTPPCDACKFAHANAENQHGAER